MNISKHTERAGSRVHSICSSTLALCNGGAAVVCGLGAIVSPIVMTGVTVPTGLILFLDAPSTVNVIFGPSVVLYAEIKNRVNAASDNLTMSKRLHRFARGKEWEAPDPSNHNRTPSEQKKIDQIQEKMKEKVDKYEISSPKLISRP